MSKKIIDLTALTTPAIDDLLVVRDTSAGATKKITVSDLLNTPGAIGRAALSSDSSWAWTSYTPTWSSVTIGNATVVARYTQVGKTVRVRINVIVGSTTNVTGIIRFSLPVTSAAYAGTANVTPIGIGTMYDVAPGTVYEANVTWVSIISAGIALKPANGTWVTWVNADNTNPVTWAAGDEWSFYFEYEAA